MIVGVIIHGRSPQMFTYSYAVAMALLIGSFLWLLADLTTPPDAH